MGSEGRGQEGATPLGRLKTEHALSGEAACGEALLGVREKATCHQGKLGPRAKPSHSLRRGGELCTSKAKL